MIRRSSGHRDGQGPSRDPAVLARYGFDVVEADQRFAGGILCGQEFTASSEDCRVQDARADVENASVAPCDARPVEGCLGMDDTNGADETGAREGRLAEIDIGEVGPLEFGFEKTG